MRWVFYPEFLARTTDDGDVALRLDHPADQFSIVLVAHVRASTGHMGQFGICNRPIVRAFERRFGAPDLESISRYDGLIDAVQQPSLHERSIGGFELVVDDHVTWWQEEQVP